MMRCYPSLYPQGSANYLKIGFMKISKMPSITAVGFFTSI
jgi:hypothetical protein